MGFPDVADDDLAFGERDIEVVSRLRERIDAGLLSEEDVLRLARVSGASFSRLVEAQLGLLDDIVADLTGTDPDSPQFDRSEAMTIITDADVLDLIEDSMMYVWRRHLFAALGQRLLTADSSSTDAIAFVDLCGFTKLGASLSKSELTHVIESFEAVVFDVAPRHSARIVKLIGDEAMLATANLDDALAACLEMIAELSEIEAMPPVHCGLAIGPTVTTGGDVFGEPVNLASRLTDVAQPGSIVLTRDDGDHLLERDDLDVRKVRRSYNLKGIGRTSVLAIRPLAADAE